MLLGLHCKLEWEAIHIYRGLYIPLFGEFGDRRSIDGINDILEIRNEYISLR